MKKTLLAIITLSALNFGAAAQNVNIPDANFKACLVGNSAINTNSDTEIQVSEAEAFTGTITCQSQSISDLTGIEAFVSLTKLICSFSSLTSLNVSQNIALTELSVHNNNISTLDVSQNTALTKLYCHANNLTNLDVSQNTALTIFFCNQNNLSTLDVSQNTALTKLSCQVNNLTSLDVSQNVALTELLCQGNNLANLDVSQNVALTELNCQSNNLPNLNVSQNTALTRLHCSTNNLTDLDVTQNTALDYLYCDENSISTLDVSQNIALTRLSCYNNNLTNLDVSQNIDLTRLKCFDNNLTNLDVGQNIALTSLECQLNSLTNLDISQNTALEELTCQENNLTTLDLSQNTDLEAFNCTSNNLTVLILKNISTNQLSDFEATSNPNLTCIEVDDVAEATAEWTNIDTQTSFSEDCNYTIPVTSISVQGQGGATTISTLGGTLQMEAEVFPMNATDATYTWGIINLTGTADIDANGLVTAMTDGTVKVTVTANDGSGVNGSVNITISNQSSSIETLKTIPNITIYPNPTNAQINITAEANIETVSIKDIMGKTVKMIVEPNNTIDVSDLTQGIYFLEIQVDDTLLSKKIIKE